MYVRDPLGFDGSIPLFSSPTEYTDNYERISGDHLLALHSSGMNPFIEEELWLETEQSTEDMVRAYTVPGHSILDVGVGLGRLLSKFPDRRRFGVDISLGYLREAQAKGIEVAYALVEDMPYPQSAFDSVVCTDVLEHVIDLYSSCRTILNVLKPGGILIARVPYREDLSQYIAAENPYKFVHVRNFDEASLRILFGTVFGCRILEVRTTGWAPYAGRRKHELIPNFLPSRLLALVRRLNGEAYRSLVRRWYLPVEINVVVQKVS
jgi:SAM-dependent methyltransferase